jgi:hypothetical protein
LLVAPHLAHRTRCSSCLIVVPLVALAALVAPALVAPRSPRVAPALVAPRSSRVAPRSSHRARRAALVAQRPSA